MTCKSTETILQSTWSRLYYIDWLQADEGMRICVQARDHLSDFKHDLADDIYPMDPSVGKLPVTDRHLARSGEMQGAGM